MQERATEVCKACMLGDKETIVQHIDQNPELVNHADDQACESAKLDNMMLHNGWRTAAHVMLQPRPSTLVNCAHKLAGSLTVALGCIKQLHRRR
jgi:hypothetical protein